MSVQVDPIILQKLEDFRRRRRNLIILRGLCSLVISLLAVFTAIAVIDYIVADTAYFLSDDFRTPSVSLVMRSWFTRFGELAPVC